MTFKLRYLLLNDSPRYPLLAIKELSHFIIDRFKSLIKGRGLFIAFLGPDGSGKSTITNWLLKEIKVYIEFRT